MLRWRYLVIVFELAFDGAMPTVEWLVPLVVCGDRCGGIRLLELVQFGANRSTWEYFGWRRVRVLQCG